MTNKTYRLQYLPLFYDDLNHVILYISNVLHNRNAATKLLDSVEKAIQERLYMPEAFEPYKSCKERESVYYRIYVENFIIFYVVMEDGDEKIMEIRRFLNRKQDIKLNV